MGTFGTIFRYTTSGYKKMSSGTIVIIAFSIVFLLVVGAIYTYTQFEND